MSDYSPTNSGILSSDFYYDKDSDNASDYNLDQSMLISNVVDQFDPETNERSVSPKRKNKSPQPRKKNTDEASESSTSTQKQTKTESVGSSVALIIDPQNDFFPASQSASRKKGSMAIQGANSDIRRYIDFIKSHPDIKHIVVSQDTHSHYDIGHPGFWVNDYGKHPEPFTVITVDDIESEKWQPLKRKSAAYILKYAKKLAQNNHHKITIWPYHGIKTQPGHRVVKELKDFLEVWEGEDHHTVEYLEKGSNPYTEFYSLFRADVPLKSDPSTELNRTLVNKLKGFDKLYIGGESLSHCVNYSVRDIIANWPDRRRAIIVFLKDTSSPIAGFEDDAADFLKFAKDSGITVTTTQEA